jgi:hypothetical protein
MREHAYFFRRWNVALERDPFHDPNFDPEKEDLRLLRRGPIDLAVASLEGRTAGRSGRAIHLSDIPVNPRSSGPCRWPSEGLVAVSCLPYAATVPIGLGLAGDGRKR